MTILYAPSEKGFDARLETIDRCQIALLRELLSQQGNRLILKGGMAMRVAFGSLRLTKDIDFDRTPSLSQDALHRGLQSSLRRAAAATGIRQAQADITKNTKTTVRARLSGVTVAGMEVRFDIEVSGRTAPEPSNLRAEVVVTPPQYGMAPFPVTTYTNEALAAMKIAAALSEQRHAPRDLYDLRDLVRAGVDPSALLARQEADLLEDFANRALTKLEMLSYPLAQQELLPYLPVAEREALSEDVWIEATLTVADQIVQWCQAARRRQTRGDVAAPGLAP